MKKSTKREPTKGEIEERMAKKLGELETAQVKSLTFRGNMIAKREKYQELDGVDAVKHYLIQKHHWLPSQINAMTTADLCFAVAEETDSAQ